MKSPLQGHNFIPRVWCHHIWKRRWPILDSLLCLDMKLHLQWKNKKGVKWLLIQIISSFLNGRTDLLFLIRTHNCSTKSRSPRSKRKMGVSVSEFSFVFFKKFWRSMLIIKLISKWLKLWNVQCNELTFAGLAAWSSCVFVVFWSSETREEKNVIFITNCLH